ncbi:MAG: NAD-dependent epimerase/dehydratase family protein [Flavobacteriia bacterium]|nr:NAD-dependent epimerase/dehydratase family protein [Flavobacteriia bacterium]
MASTTYITGHTGFIGSHLKKHLGTKAQEVNLRVSKNISLSPGDALVHLAGKAHDLKNTSDASEYFEVNTELTKELFEQFLASEARDFVFMSSIKALEGKDKGASAYSQSKHRAEEYILSKQVPEGKRVFILRPVMVHGPNNKGNLNLLFGAVKRFGFWPLAAFQNKRSFVAVDNVCFMISEILANPNIPSGTYTLADATPFSTNELVAMAAEALHTKVRFVAVPKGLVRGLAYIGGGLGLALNPPRLEKLTENAVYDGSPLLSLIGKEVPLTPKEGFKKTFESFVNHDG